MRRFLHSWLSWLPGNLKRWGLPSVRQSDYSQRFRTLLVLGLFSLVTWLALFGLTSGARAQSATATWEPLFSTSTPQPTQNYNCPAGSPIGAGTVTPNPNWLLSCGQCLVATGTPWSTPTQGSTTLQPGTTGTPGAGTGTPGAPTPAITVTPTPAGSAYIHVIEHNGGSADYQGSSLTIQGAYFYYHLNDPGVMQNYYATVYYQMSGYANGGGHWDNDYNNVWTYLTVNSASVFSVYQGRFPTQTQFPFSYSGSFTGIVHAGTGGTQYDYMILAGTSDFWRNYAHEQTGPHITVQLSMQPINPTPTPSPSPSPTPTYQPGLCREVQGSAVVTQIRLPVPRVGAGTCVTIFDGTILDFGLLSWLPGVPDIGEVQLPTLRACVRPVVFGSVDWGVFALDIDIVIMFISGVAAVMFLLKDK